MTITPLHHEILDRFDSRDPDWRVRADAQRLANSTGQVMEVIFPGRLAKTLIWPAAPSPAPSS